MTWPEAIAAAILTAFAALITFHHQHRTPHPSRTEHSHGPHHHPAQDRHPGEENPRPEDGREEDHHP